MADLSDSIPVTEIPRQIVEAEIEMLIDLLDRLDANPDLEDGADIENDQADDEPYHGAPEQQAGSWGGINPSIGGDDGEEVELGWTELEARFGRYRAWSDNGYEPSLGSNGAINQLKWSKGTTDDREDEHDGREDCCEDEGAQCDDEGEIHGDAEPDYHGEGTGNHQGPRSPVETLFGGHHAN
jgi:hypothetical protein